MAGSMPKPCNQLQIPTARTPRNESKCEDDQAWPDRKEETLVRTGREAKAPLPAASDAQEQPHEHKYQRDDLIHRNHNLNFDPAGPQPASSLNLARLGAPGFHTR